ncbi:MAG: phenylalanine--tRNA ligase subunit beta [Candidatus Omnitrophota bacterium]
MKFSLDFIKEFIDVEIPPEVVAARLTMSGMEVEKLERHQADWIFDIEVTSNRFDWLSMHGIARELSACLGKAFKVKYPAITKKPLLKKPSVVIENLKDCPYYVGRSLSGVKVSQSPRWLKERIVNCGINSINNVVDITNYCMLKWGNPLHAFDQDKIEGNVYVRRACKGEKFIGIDEKERVLTKDNLVIADDKKIIALAGVIGEKFTEVTESTTNVFLEAAIFSPLTVRRSRRLAGVDTESSYRFERMVHPDCLEYASSEASKIIEQLAKAKQKGYCQSGKKPLLKRKAIEISPAKVSSYLGEEFSFSILTKILKSLDFTVINQGKGELKISPSRFRFDIDREVDVYEEISRIHGYEHIRPKIPFLLSGVRQDELYEFKNALRLFLSSLALREIVSFSIEAQEELGKLSKIKPIMIANPLRNQENAMRATLLIGMLKSIKNNLNRNQTRLKFFEIANVYSMKDNTIYEEPFLSMGICTQDKGLFLLKAYLEELLRYLNIEQVEINENARDNFTNCLEFISEKQELGFLGKLNCQTAKEFDIKEDVFYVELNINILNKIKKNTLFEHFSPYPAVSRDISLTIREDTKFAEIESLMRKQAPDCLANVKVIDEYEGKDIPENVRAFTLRVLYQSKERTLTSAEIDQIHTNIRNSLNSLDGITLR